ncbi:hypothetical protein HDU67_001684 [Dinochytrium kinnereticum]|nr:hypothetical protein HDU67_001684 [Dinochytrium kinnereticum]
MAADAKAKLEASAREPPSLKQIKFDRMAYQKRTKLKVMVRRRKIDGEDGDESSGSEFEV